MKRKFLSLVLALVMVLGTVSAVFAETTPLTSSDAKVQWLVDNKVVVGRTVNKDDTNPDLALDKTITRAEVSKLLVYTLGQEKLADVLKGAIKVFPDVDLDHWANGYISVLATNRTEVASGRDVVIGYEDGYFRPSNDVTYAELATMLVRIVKADLTKKMEDEAIWATSYIRWAEELGILDGITLVNSNAPAVRKDAFVMIYNAMHKLNLVGQNKVDWGIKIGIVSKLQAGKIELNQDKEKTYNLTYDTKVTNGTAWDEVNVNTVVPGSLVRLVADENGNVSHLMVVSVPRMTGKWDNQGNILNETAYDFYTGFHAVGVNRLFDLGQSVANGFITFTSDYRPYGDIQVYQNFDKKQLIATIEQTSDQRVFVADPRNNALKEVDSVAAALRVFADKNKPVKGYVIYDTFTKFDGKKVNEANYIVFTEVDRYHGDINTLRVRYTTNSLYDVALENTKGELVHKNLGHVPFLQTSYGIAHEKDVVTLKDPVGNSTSSYADLRIDYRKDNIYRVEELQDRYLVVSDANPNRRVKIGMPAGTMVFLEGQLKVGSFIQIDRGATLSNVKIISVVDGPARGTIGFPGEEVRLEGTITNVFASAIQGGYSVVTMTNVKDAHNNQPVTSYGDTFHVLTAELQELADKVAVDPGVNVDLKGLVGEQVLFDAKYKVTGDKSMLVATNLTILKSVKDQHNDLWDNYLAEWYNTVKPLVGTPVTDANFEQRYTLSKAVKDAFDRMTLQARYDYMDLMDEWDNSNDPNVYKLRKGFNEEVKALNKFILDNNRVEQPIGEMPSK